MEITLKGQTFTSTLSDAEAIAVIEKMTDNSFAQSLVRQYVVRGRLSEKQWPWVHKLAMEKISPPAPASTGPDCLAIVTLFAIASQSGLKRPRMTFPQARFSLAGSLSRYPGSIHVGTGPGGRYFGRIDSTGKFIPGRDASMLDMAFLSAFAADPANFAVANGKESGSCRFCNLTLTTTESVSVGYGPVCAKHWGLPWGHKPH